MNVESLRGNKDLAQQSAEIRIAKVAIGICCLFLLSWTPYAICALIAAFGNRLELQKKMPWFCINEPDPPADNASNASEKTQNA